MTDGNPMLGDVADFVRGVTYKPEDVTENFAEGSLVCMRTANVQATLDESSLVSIPRTLVRNTEKLLAEGDLLVSTANSWNLVGKCCWVPRLDYPATAGGFIAILRGDDAKIDRRYLYHWFSTPKTQLEARNCGRQTTNISNMDINRCLALRIPLPSLPEQRRIAAILDKADALRAKRREAIAKLDQLLQSVFVDMFGDPVTNQRGWPTEALSRLTSKIGSGSTPKGGDSSYQDEGISFIRSLNVHDGEFRHKNLAFIDETQAKKLSGVTVESGDVFLNITGASVARVCRVPDDVLPARVNQHVSIIRCASRLVPVFLEHVLMNQSMKNALLRTAGAGATREAITKKQIEELQVPVPPLDMQHRFSAVSEKVSSQRRCMAASLAEKDRLFAAIQTAAFPGEM